MYLSGLVMGRVYFLREESDTKWPKFPPWRNWLMREVLISIIIFVIISRAHIDLYPIIGPGRPAHKTAQTTCQEVLTWVITALLRTNHHCLFHTTTCLHGSHMGLAWASRLHESSGTIIESYSTYTPIKCFLSLLVKFWSEWDIVCDLFVISMSSQCKNCQRGTWWGIDPPKKMLNVYLLTFFLTISLNWVGPFAVSTPISQWR